MLQPIHYAPFLPVPDQCAAVHRAVQHGLALRGKHGREALLRHRLDLLRGIRAFNIPFVLVRPHRDKVRLPALLPDQQICPSGMRVDGNAFADTSVNQESTQRQ